MFILTKKVGANYEVYDSINESSEIVNIDSIKNAVRLGVKILGVSVINGMFLSHSLYIAFFFCQV